MRGVGQAADSSKGGLQAAADGFMDVAKNAMVVGGAIGTAVVAIDKINELGAASIRARNSLDIMSGGKATQFISAMKESTRGLVTEMDLAAQATKGLTLGIITT